MNISNETKRRIQRVTRWFTDMVLFVFTFWVLTMAGWTLAGLALDAAMHEINQMERQALDAQGREAWDRYCLSVYRGEREDDLETTYAECSEHEWEYPVDQDIAKGWDGAPAQGVTP